MRRTLVPLLAVFAVAFFVTAAEVADDGIAVSPNTINLSSQSTVVTVHTDLPYSLVEHASVTLNGVDIAWWKYDNQGYFVAKFDADDVKDVLTEGEITIVLCGELVGGEVFSYEDTIKVIDVKAKK